MGIDIRLNFLVKVKKSVFNHLELQANVSPTYAVEIPGEALI
jgi:hypothetical protein